MRRGTPPQELPDFLAGTSDPTAGDPMRVAERACDDIDMVQDAELFRRAAPAGAQDAGGMAIIDHNGGLIALSELTDFRKPSQVAVHGENAICGDELEPTAGRFTQTLFQIIHIGVLIAIPFG